MDIQKKKTKPWTHTKWRIWPKTYTEKGRLIELNCQEKFWDPASGRDKIVSFENVLIQPKPYFASLKKVSAMFYCH